MARTPRRQKLVLPALQIRLVAWFVGLAAGALLLQFLLLAYRVASLTAAADGEGGELASEVPGLLLQVLVFSGAVLLPVIFLVGILLTHPIAGPAFRIEQHLRALARGEDVGPCRIRSRDQLQSLCQAVNEATDALRRGQAPAARVATDEPAAAPRDAA